MSEVSWHVELEVSATQVEEFRRLTAEMVAFTETEQGVLAYERFENPSGEIVHIYERYANSQAAIDHLQTFLSEFGPRFSALIERRQFNVFGDPTPELRKLLGGFGAQFFSRLSGT